MIGIRKPEAKHKQSSYTGLNHDGGPRQDGQPGVRFNHATQNCMN